MTAPRLTAVQRRALEAAAREGEAVTDLHTSTCLVNMGLAEMAHLGPHWVRITPAGRAALDGAS